jgi:hypothetical protein
VHLEAPRHFHSRPFLAPLTPAKAGTQPSSEGRAATELSTQRTSFFVPLIPAQAGTQSCGYNTNFSAASYTHAQFKTEVTNWLIHKFGQSVKPGKKAIRIPANGTRRDADVLVASDFRRYTSYTNASAYNFHKGICFWLPDGTRVENFPKQHSANCTTKHQNTNSRFKPMVRIWKNLRNRMVADGKITKGLAPSYTFANCYAWVMATDKTKLTTASGLHWLSRDNSHTCWPTADMNSFLAAVKQTWDNWQ